MTYRRYRQRSFLWRHVAAVAALLLLGLLAAAAVAQAQDPATTETATTETSTPGATDTGTTETEPPPVVADGVTIAGVAVGGMTGLEATAAVRAAFAAPVVVTFRRERRDVLPSRLGARPLVAAAVATALSAAPGEAVPLGVALDGVRLRAWVASYARSHDRAPVNSTVRLRRLRPFVTRARNGWAIRRFAFRHALRSALLAHARGPIAVPYVVRTPRVTRANFGPVVVIRRGSRLLTLYHGMRFVRRFSVAVGLPQYPTPLGRFSIVTKQRNPWWYPPSSDWARGLDPVPPGPGNPLGTRWMGLSAPGVGIHGTPDAASIGYSASHGCIRMRIREAEWLFERVRVGTTVFIARA